MKPFTFSLESVRTVRQRRERESMEAYARALACRQAATERFQEAGRRLAESWVQFNSELIGGSTAGGVTQLRAFCENLESMRKQAESELRAADDALEKVMQRMLEARRDREAVDKFYDAQKVVYDRALSREEQKQLDELAGRRSSAWMGDTLWTEAAHA